MTTVLKSDFAQKLHDLIEDSIKAGAPPEDIFEELVGQANSTFGHYNLEYVLKPEPQP